jgi:hypothetical protein
MLFKLLVLLKTVSHQFDIIVLKLGLTRILTFQLMDTLLLIFRILIIKLMVY